MSEQHKTRVETVREPGRRSHKFVVKCSCGWESKPLSTSGMAASVSDRHITQSSAGGLA